MARGEVLWSWRLLLELMPLWKRMLSRSSRKKEREVWLAFLCARMPGNTGSNSYCHKGAMALKANYLKRGGEARLSRKACHKDDNDSAMWMLREPRELPNRAGNNRFFEEGCLANFLSLLPHQLLQVGLSTGAGGLGFTSTARRRVSAFVCREPL